MMEQVGFWAVALATIGASLMVVRGQNLIRAVLWLALSLLGTAVLYAMLQAPFLAGVQVLTYIGGVVTLLVFGVMVTGRHQGGPIVVDSVEPMRGAMVAAGLFVLLALAVLKSDLGPVTAPHLSTTAQLGASLLTEHLVAFEVASVLLLAAIIGAVVIARRVDPDPKTGLEPGPLTSLRAGAGRS